VASAIVRPVSEGSLRRALEYVAPHCDIVERLADVPPSARVRGLYFRSFLGILRQECRITDYERFFPDESWSSLPFYPLSDYLIRIAVAGAVVASPSSLHDGIYRVARSNAMAFTSSILGKVLLRILDRDPLRLTEQALSARRQSTTYGEWTLAKHGPNGLEMAYRGEYMWLESAIAGAAAGTFEACDVKPQLSTVLNGKYNGSTLIRW
jgi:uncharacterized protein (TIGR02265 family)